MFHQFKTSVFFRERESVKNCSNLRMDSSKKLPTEGERSKIAEKFADILNDCPFLDFYFESKTYYASRNSISSLILIKHFHKMTLYQIYFVCSYKPRIKNISLIEKFRTLILNGFYLKGICTSNL